MSLHTKKTNRRKAGGQEISFKFALPTIQSLFTPYRGTGFVDSEGMSTT